MSSGYWSRWPGISQLFLLALQTEDPQDYKEKWKDLIFVFHRQLGKLVIVIKLAGHMRVLIKETEQRSPLQNYSYSKTCKGCPRFFFHCFYYMRKKNSPTVCSNWKFANETICFLICKMRRLNQVPSKVALKCYDLILCFFIRVVHKNV